MTPDAPTAPAAPDGPPKGKPFLVLLLIAAVVGLVVSLAAWLFLEAVHQTQVGVFDKLPEQLGYAARRCGGRCPSADRGRDHRRGDHAAARLRRPRPRPGPGDEPGPPDRPPRRHPRRPRDRGPRPRARPRGAAARPGQRPRRLRRAPGEEGAPQQVVAVLAAAGSFAAVSFLFESPMIAAVLLIEAIGLGGRQLTFVLIPGLLASAVGSLVSIGLGSFTGLSTSGYAIGLLDLPDFRAPDPGRLRVDGPGRGRHHAPGPGGGPPRPPRPATRDARAVRAHPDRGSRRRRPGDRLHAGHRQGLRPGPVLRPGRDRPAGGEPGRVVGGRARRGAARSRAWRGASRSEPSGAARRSRRCSSASRPACSPPTCRAST